MINKNILQHIIAIALAAIISIVVTGFLSVEKLYNHFEINLDQPKAGFTNLYYPKYYNDSVSLLFADALKTGNKIVCYGSSELTNEALPAIPYNFLPKQTGLNCLAIGHAGNQLLSILTQLSAMNKWVNKKSKIVIILSPGWFATEGTSVHSFLEYVNDNFLHQIESDNDIPLKVKTHIFSFLAKNINNISGATPFIKHIAYRQLANDGMLNGITYNLFRAIYSDAKPHNVVSYSGNIMSAPLPIINYDFNWDSSLNNALTKTLAAATNNKLGAENDFYNNTFLQQGKSAFKIPRHYKKGEFADLEILIEYLKNKNCNVQFIMQPVNPHMYYNINEMKEVISEVIKLLDENKMTYTNFFTADTAKYEIGILSDAQHFSEYGWLKANYEIFKHFGDYEKTNN